MSGSGEATGAQSLFRLLRGHRLRIASLSGLALVGGLAESVVLVEVVQAAVKLSSQDAGTFDLGPIRLQGAGVGTLLAIALFATAIRLVTALAVAWLGAALTAEVQREMRVALFDAYVDADWTAQSREREGGLQQVSGLEIDRSALAVLTLSTGLSAACSLLMLLVVALVVSVVAAVGLIVVVGVLFLALRPLTVRVRQYATTRSEGELDVSLAVDEMVSAAEEIRVHGVGEEAKRRIAAVTASVANSFRRVQFSSASIPNLYQSAALGLVVAALFVVNEVGISSAGASGAIVLILLRAFSYSQQLQHAYHQLGERMTSVGVVTDRIDSYRARAVRDGALRLSTIEAIEFRHVSYSYRPGQPALDDLSLRVERGEVIGVVGPSGAGKSTLVQILLRLRAPDRGEYLINRSLAAEVSNEDWARLVSFLPQHPRIIAGSVADNIRFMRDIPLARVEEAARTANLHEEIVSWPDGYDTRVGQRADALSGGQAQRLCLARALVTNPSLLVLDEPTSALDAVSEHAIHMSLEGLRGQATVVIIAHRLSTLNSCDRLLVLRDGHCEAFRPRQELADMDGFYREALRLSGLT